MDFHLLNRRQLQTLCKKNKIPANITNIAMADALAALHIVQGMEELSIESPARPQVITTASLAGATSTNRTTTATRRTKSFKHESDENLQPSTNRTTRRSSRSDVHQGNRTPATALKMDTLHFNGIEVEDKEEDANDLSHYTPAVLPTTRQRAALTLEGGDTTQTRVQGTRRSTRLAAKNKQGNNTNDQISETVLKMDFGEIMEINVKGQCSADADVDSVAETVGVIDLNEKSEEGLDKSNISVLVWDAKSDCSARKHSKPETGFNEDSGQDSEVVESKMIVDGDGAEGIMCNNVPKHGNGNKSENSLESGEELHSNDVAAENVEEIPMDHFESGGELDRKDVAAEDAEEIPMDHLGDAFSVDNGIDLNTSKEEVESEQDFGPSHYMEMFQTETKNVVEDGIALDGKKEVESSDCAAENQESEKGRNLEDLNHVAALERDDESADTEIEPKTEEAGMGIIESAIEPEIEESNYFVEEAVENNLAEKINAMELNAFCSERELSWVEDAEFRLEPSMAVEGGLTKDLTGDPGVAVNSAILEELVAEIQANPEEEEDLKNTCVECGAKTQDVSAVDLIFTAGGGIAELSSDVTVDSNENVSNLGASQLFVPRLNDLSPVKASSSPTPGKKIPLQKSVSSKTPTSGKRIMLVSDDKENIEESGLLLTEKNEKKEIRVENTCEKPCWEEASLRKLKKELKAKLERGNKNVKVGGGGSGRPALQPVTENRLMSD